jgi:hypothetical protein
LIAQANEASKRASNPASNPASNQSTNQSIKQASKQASEQRPMTTLKDSALGRDICCLLFIVCCLLFSVVRQDPGSRVVMVVS